MERPLCKSALLEIFTIKSSHSMEPQLNSSAPKILKAEINKRNEKNFIRYVGTLSGTGLHFSSLV